MIKEIITAVQGVVTGLNIKPALLVIPVAIALSMALILFAKNSYKLFKFALPVFAALAGAFIGAGMLGGMLAGVPGGYWIAGGVAALVIGFLCSKLHKLTMFIVGAGLGAVVVDVLVKNLLWKLDFVHTIAESVPGGKAGMIVTVVGFIILAVCALVCAKILSKYFRGIYIILTSVVFTLVAVVLPVILAFGALETIGEIAVIAAAVIGLFFGIKTAVKQFKLA